MEEHRARKLTTAAVAVGLVLAIICMIVGIALGMGQPESEISTLGMRAVGGGLASGSPSAWLSLGALLLVATPCVRMVGLMVVLQTQGERRALAACAVLLVVLVGGIGRALM